MGPNGEIPTERGNDCWNVQTDELMIYDVLNRIELEPTESVSNSYALLARSEETQNGCFADGSFSYSDSVTLGNDESREAVLELEIVVADGEITELDALSVEIT